MRILAFVFCVFASCDVAAVSLPFRIKNQREFSFGAVVAAAGLFSLYKAYVFFKKDIGYLHEINHLKKEIRDNGGQIKEWSESFGPNLRYNHIKVKWSQYLSHEAVECIKSCFNKIEELKNDSKSVSRCAVGFAIFAMVALRFGFDLVYAQVN